MSETGEKVLVVPRQHMPKLNGFNMYRFDGQTTSEYINLITRIQTIAGQYGVYKLRSEVEYDPSYLQVIPYCLVQNHAGRYFAVQRTSRGGEERLHSKVSIGIGGHINPEDEEAGTLSQRIASDGIYDRIYHGMVRELDEEIVLDRGSFLSPIGEISLENTLVNQVHFGLVFKLQMGAATDIEVKEKDKLEGLGFRSARTILNTDSRRLEDWSTAILEVLQWSGTQVR